MTLLGRSHPVVRRVRRLGRSRAAREEEGVFLAEGIHLAEEALAGGADVRMAVVSPALARLAAGSGLRRRLEEAGVEVLETSDRVLESLQDAHTPQPILLLVGRQPASEEDALRGRPGTALVVVAHGLQDPGNLGSILRTADAAGATGLLASGESVDLFHPRTVRASMGSIFRLPAASASPGDLPSRLRSRGLTTVAADPSASESHEACDLGRPLALLFGREGCGLPAMLLDRVDHRVRIPMTRGVESLSVGAAAAVLLYEAARQRRKGF